MHLVITRSKDKKEGWADKPFFTEQETTSDNIELVNIQRRNVRRYPVGQGITLIKEIRDIKVDEVRNQR